MRVPLAPPAHSGFRNRVPKIQLQLVVVVFVLVVVVARLYVVVVALRLFKPNVVVGTIARVRLPLVVGVAPHVPQKPPMPKFARFILLPPIPHLVLIPLRVPPQVNPTIPKVRRRQSTNSVRYIRRRETRYRTFRRRLIGRNDRYHTFRLYPAISRTVIASLLSLLASRSRCHIG